MILRDYQKKAVSKALSQKVNTLIACPTGSGKTAILGGICKELLLKNSSTKILIVSHVQEIIKQDFEALVQFVNPDILGIYSAGIGYRNVEQITVAGVQSIYSKGLFTDYDYILVDEAHLIPLSGDGMYRQLVEDFKGVVIGLTATPYRLGKGYIYGEDKIFKNMCYNLTQKDNFNKLVSDGYLSKIYAYEPKSKLNVKGIHTVAGDFSLSEMSSKFNRKSITKKCLTEILTVKNDYKKMLLFCIDIKHSEDVSDMLIEMGISCKAVHSKMKGRDLVIDELRTGKIKAITNVDVLTTGFDDPEIDLIVLLRPTKSPVVHVQTIGRGLRVSPGKKHCLVMDFAGNTKRLGPINDIVPYVAKKGGKGEPIVKTCPKCSAMFHPSVKVCDICGHVFQFKTELSTGNSGTTIMKSNSSIPICYDVKSVSYSRHAPIMRINSVLVTYNTKKIGLSFREWVCVEHQGYAKRMATVWLRKRGVVYPINTVDEFLSKTKSFYIPKSIIIKKDGLYPEIIKINF